MASIIGKVKGLFGVGESGALKEREQSSDAEIEKLLRQHNPMSMPRDLMFSSISQGSDLSVSRNSAYLNQYEMYEDAFSREMVKVIIARAIGVTHDNNKPFTISIKQDSGLHDSMVDSLNEELEKLTGIIDKNLLEVVIDSQFFGDGYAKRVLSSDKGLVSLDTNISTKPVNITPIVTNKGRSVAYETTINGKMFGRKNSGSLSRNGRNYSSIYSVARLSAVCNGITRVTSDNLSTIEDFNLFSDQEVAYEDSIFGGVMEDCKDSFDNYKWAINALVNLRISSSVVERFITQDLGSLSEPDRKSLKQAFSDQIKQVRENINNRVKSKDPTSLIANYNLATVGESGVGGVSIQESNPTSEGLRSSEDIMIHIKRYMADVGFSLELTPFAGNTNGGTERDGVIQNSLQMDVQGSQIRASIREYILDNIKVHFLAKYNQEINTDIINISFTSVINKSKMVAEQQRLEALTNSQQFLAVVEQVKTLGFEDNNDNREAVFSMLDEITATNIDKRDNYIKSLVSFIMTKTAEEE